MAGTPKAPVTTPVGRSTVFRASEATMSAATTITAPVSAAAAMRRRGVVGDRKEWWHFSLANEPYPTIYFDFPVR